MHRPIDYQHLVPVEVWIACWAFCNTRQLRRISLVCRQFRSLSLPFLFQDQTLDVASLVYGLAPNNWINRFHRLHRAAVRLDSLATSPFPALVRSWQVKFAERVDASSYIKHAKFCDEMRHRAMSSFFTTLGLYKNVSFLHIKTLVIDAAVVETLRDLPLLETLHLRVENIDEGDHTNIGSGPPPWKLRSLHLHDAHHLLTIDAFSMSGLDRLVRFNTPRLESLTVDSPAPNSPVRSIDVSRRSLPLLRTLAGPAYLIRSLAPNRPIHSVRVVEHNMDLEDLISVCTDICRSTVSVRTLALPRAAPTIEFLRRLVALFLDVRELSLVLINPIRAHGWSVTLPNWLRPQPTSDERVPIFCDGEAFDSLPAEEVSDDETADVSAVTTNVDADSDGFCATPTPFSTVYIETVLKWIYDGSVDLPSKIKIFRLVDNYSEELPLEKQHHALVMLGERYECLREVQVGGRDTIWRRREDGEVWEVEGKSGVRIAHARATGQGEI
ncbi:hypothetical protein DFH09DRAFT_1482640 [Mycena vulgaris]|nr:hypothetical protein DFH09DRAFT_1482640 [Mycena vulgaris]